MPPPISFRQIRPHAGRQDRGFEELCFQLLPALGEKPGEVSVVRHGMPDGGIEFRADVPGEGIWAWQAKYLFSLSDAEFGQLSRSVEAALKSTARLRRYCFMLPYDRPAASTPGRKSAMQRWDESVAKWKMKARDRGSEVEFSYIGESQLLAALTQASEAGRARYWFDTTILTPDWFERQIERAVADAGPRYTPELNVNLPITSMFDGIGRLKKFQDRARVALRTVRDSMPWLPVSGKPPVDDKVATLARRCNELTREVDTRTLELNIAGTEIVDFAGLATACRAAMEAGETLYDAEVVARRDPAGPPDSGGSDNERREERNWWDSAAWRARRAIAALRELLALAESEPARLVNNPMLLLTGRPGTGKTHLLCDLALQRVQTGQPTVLLLGQAFGLRDPWAQILEELHLDCQLDEFLGALSAAAETAGSRALILLDGVNEGEGLRLWPNHLAGFLATVRGWPRLALVLSCRTSYVEALIPEGFDPDQFVRVEHEGFEGVEYRAVRSFFQFYRLQLPDFPLLIPEFQNPLFLKLTCQGISESGQTTMPRGATGSTALFGRFLSSAEQRLSRPERCDYPLQDRLVPQAVQGVAREMLLTGEDWLPTERARELVDSLLPHKSWSGSLFHGLLAEGVLTQEHSGREGSTREIVTFSYQRLGDHLRASFLCDEHDSLESIRAECQRFAEDAGTAFHNSGLLDSTSALTRSRVGHPATV